MSNKRKAKADCACIDCGWFTVWYDGRRFEWYMVTDQVWTAAGMPDQHGTGDWRHFLCIGCLEQRLGRPLRGEDFQPSTSMSSAHTDRLNDRLSR